MIITYGMLDMRMKVHLVLAIVAAWTTISNAVDFQGCFTDLVGINHTQYNARLEGNTNHDCSRYCGDRGYILAATHFDKCYCQMVFPENQLAPPVGGDPPTGPGSPCNLPCLGSLEQGDCTGDECCGGIYKGQHTYSLYAVGGIDVVTEIKRRIKRAIPHLRWLAVYSPEVADCKNEYVEKPSRRGDTVMLDLPEDLGIKHPDVITLRRCQDLCSYQSWCLSFSYQVHQHLCTLNKVQVDDANTLPSFTNTTMFDRNCTFNVEVLTRVFDLEMYNFSRIFSHGMPRNTQPLDNEDFELDLTQSVEYDTIRRVISMTSSEEYQMSTQTGFEDSESVTKAEERSNTNTNTEENNEAQEESSSKTMSANERLTFGYSVSASAGLPGIAEVSSTFSSELAIELQQSFTNSQSRSTSSSRSTSTSETQSSSTTKAKTHSNMFQNGYSTASRADKTQSYEFSMTVPALHRGVIAFFVEDVPNVLKWRASFKLNGFIAMRLKDIKKHVHVSRLLRNDERTFHVMGSLTYERRRVVGKITVWDDKGKVVSSETIKKNKDKPKKKKNN